MSGPQFFQTIMGRQFIDGTAPALVRELARLNDNFQTFISARERDRERIALLESDVAALKAELHKSKNKGAKKPAIQEEA